MVVISWKRLLVLYVREILICMYTIIINFHLMPYSLMSWSIIVLMQCLLFGANHEPLKTIGLYLYVLATKMPQRFIIFMNFQKQIIVPHFLCVMDIYWGFIGHIWAKVPQNLYLDVSTLLDNEHIWKMIHLMYF